MKRVYVAGPMSKGDQFAHIAKAMDVGQRLVEAGFSPYLPQWTFFWELRHAHPYDQCLAIDEPWVEASHAVVRIAGESNGADREVALALKKGIPVFFSADDLIASREHDEGNPGSLCLECGLDSLHSFHAIHSLCPRCRKGKLVQIFEG